MFLSRREQLLTLFRWMTRARRAQLTRSFESTCEFPACILFHHRFATQTLNGWSIQAKNFERQMDWLTFDPRKVFGNSSIDFQNHEPQSPILPQRTLVAPKGSHAVLH